VPAKTAMMREEIPKCKRQAMVLERAMRNDGRPFFHLLAAVVPSLIYQSVRMSVGQGGDQQFLPSRLSC